MTKWKYVVEVVRLNGTWVQYAVWACYPGNFRDFLNYFTSDPLEPVVRIKRGADNLEPEFQWPLIS
jgi:hypothetical protein